MTRLAGDEVLDGSYAGEPSARIQHSDAKPGTAVTFSQTGEPGRSPQRPRGNHNVNSPAPPTRPTAPR
jgi:hypothetical protein